MTEKSNKQLTNLERHNSLASLELKYGKINSNKANNKNKFFMQKSIVIDIITYILGAIIVSIGLIIILQAEKAPGSGSSFGIVAALPIILIGVFIFCAPFLSGYFMKSVRINKQDKSIKDTDPPTAE